MQRSSSFSLNGCVEIQIFLSASFNHEQRLVKQKYWTASFSTASLDASSNANVAIKHSFLESPRGQGLGNSMKIPFRFSNLSLKRICEFCVEEIDI